MARPKTPTTILDARGAFDKHPERRRHREPKSMGPIGYAPKHMSSGEREIWNEFKQIVHRGVLTKSDRPSFEILISLMYRYRWGHKQGVAVLAAGEFSRLIALLSKFGLTPSDRAGLMAGEKKKSNPFAGI